MTNHNASSGVLACSENAGGAQTTTGRLPSPWVGDVPHPPEAPRDWSAVHAVAMAAELPEWADLFDVGVLR
jgi:hypothetical protein